MVIQRALCQIRGLFPPLFALAFDLRSLLVYNIVHKPVAMEYFDYDEAPDKALTDAELATRVQAGDNEAYGQWWQNECQTDAFNVARRKGADYHDAQDAAQDAALSVWLAMRKGQADFGENKARQYAITAARNKVLDQHRRRSHRADETLVPDHGDYDMHFASSDSPEAAVIAAMHDPVSALLEHVKPERRAPIRAVHVDGYSATDYATQAGIPRGTVLTRIHRGSKELRAALETTDKQTD